MPTTQSDLWAIEARLSHLEGVAAQLKDSEKDPLESPERVRAMWGVMRAAAEQQSILLDRVPQVPEQDRVRPGIELRIAAIKDEADRGIERLTPKQGMTAQGVTLGKPRGPMTRATDTRQGLVSKSTFTKFGIGLAAGAVLGFLFGRWWRAA